MEKDEVQVDKTNRAKEKEAVKAAPVKLKAKGRSLTGKPLDNIELNPQLEVDTKQVQEQSRGGVVLTFGRMNPPTVGHEKLVDKVKTVASQKSATPMVFLSHSQDKSKNPLEYEDKVRFAQAAFGKIVQKSPAKTLIDILKSVQSKFNDVTLVVGSDRVNEFQTLLNKYNGKEYNFDSINVVSAGERDPDAEGVEGMSASKMRAAVRAGDDKKFISGLPRRLQAHGKEILQLVGLGMKLHEELEQEGLLSEVLTVDQRRKRAAIMRRNEPKIERARELAKKRLAGSDKLKKRARIKAIDMLRRKLAGKRGLEYHQLSPSERVQIDKMVAKRKKAIGRIAQKILPSIRTAEFERLKSYTQGQKLASQQHTKNEEFNRMFEDYASNIETYTVDDMLEEMTSLVLDKIITEKQIAALEKRAERSGIEFDILEQVYVRGLLDSMGDQTAAFNRVNAFICGGKTAMNEDYDLYQQVQRPDINDVFEGLKDPKDNPCWDGYKPVGTKKLRGKTVPNCVPEAVEENFMDGKGPGKPGDAARHGLKGKSAAELKKIRSSDSASPRQKQLAHWMLNMHHNESVSEGLKTGAEMAKDLNAELNKALSKGTLKRIKVDAVPDKDEKRNQTQSVERDSTPQTPAVDSQHPTDPTSSHYKQAQIKKKIIDESVDLNESFNMAMTAGIGITLTAADLGMRTQGGFALHPSVVEEEEEFVDEAAKTADRAPVVIPTHKDAYGNVIPAKTVMKKKAKAIVNTGDNPNDGQ